MICKNGKLALGYNTAAHVLHSHHANYILWTSVLTKTAIFISNPTVCTATSRKRRAASWRVSIKGGRKRHGGGAATDKDSCYWWQWWWCGGAGGAGAAASRVIDPATHHRRKDSAPPYSSLPPPLGFLEIFEISTADAFSIV